MESWKRLSSFKLLYLTFLSTTKLKSFKKASSSSSSHDKEDLKYFEGGTGTIFFFRLFLNSILS